MKHQVKISTYSWVVTILGLSVMIGLLIMMNIKEAPIVSIIVWSVILVAICFMALYYSPLAISVDKDTLNIHRSLKVKSIPLSEIQSVQLCPPTMAERRICGSGGWFGYWGWFKEPSIGKYFAYYGKASDCFLVVLKNGRQYLLSCKDPKEIVSYLSEHIG